MFVVLLLLLLLAIRMDVDLYGIVCMSCIVRSSVLSVAY